MHLSISLYLSPSLSLLPVVQPLGMIQLRETSISPQDTSSSSELIIILSVLANQVFMNQIFHCTCTCNYYIYIYIYIQYLTLLSLHTMMGVTLTNEQ